MVVTFPFFVGCGRSGTTLFRTIFNANSQLAVVNESHFIVPLARRRIRHYERGEQFGTAEFVTDVLADGTRFRSLGITRADLEAGLRDWAPLTYADAVRCVFALYARQHGKPRYADKTPGYSGHLSMLAVLFPEARFVHIIRDGRDVALAYLDRATGPGTIEETAWHWKRNVARARKAGDRLGSNRYLEVRYESLLKRPEGTVRKICAFLELPFEAEMFRFFENPELRSSAKLSRPVHQNLQRPITKGLRDWRTQMTHEDVAVFESIAGRLLDDLQYGRATAVPPLTAAARVGRSWLHWQHRRARHQLAAFRRKLGQ